MTFGIGSLTRHSNNGATMADPSTRNLGRHVERATLRTAAMRRELRWESGLDADGNWLRRLVSPWESDPEKPENAYARAASDDIRAGEERQ